MKNHEWAGTQQRIWVATDLFPPWKNKFIMGALGKELLPKIELLLLLDYHQLPPKSAVVFLGRSTRNH